MAVIQKPILVKIICGMISGREDWFAQATEKFAARFGAVEHVSEYYPFENTHYYESEMGGELKKHFISLTDLVDPAELTDIKRYTNELEDQFAAAPAAAVARPINLDPGYLTESKLVLASMKDFSHRIYLRDGVFGEVTLQWRAGSWQSLPWTFPDFASGQYDVFLAEVRQSYRRQLGRSGQ